MKSKSFQSGWNNHLGRLDYEYETARSNGFDFDRVPKGERT